MMQIECLAGCLTEFLPILGNRACCEKFVFEILYSCIIGIQETL